MRSLFLILCVVTAYAFMRGWPAGMAEHPILRTCFAVLILVLGFGVWGKRSRPGFRAALPFRPAAWPDYAAIGLGVLAIECLALFFFSMAPPKAEGLAYAIEGVILPERAAARAEAAGLLPDSSSRKPSPGNWLWDSQGRRKLPDRLAARPSNKPEVYLRPADRPTTSELLNRAYVRAFALERFNDSTWSAQPIDPEPLTADNDGWIRFESLPGRSGPDLRCEIFHAAHPGGQDVFTSLQGTTAAEIPQLRRIAPGILRLLPLADPTQGYDYHITARTVTFSRLLAAGTLNGKQVEIDDAPEHLLELPDENSPEQATLRQGILDFAFTTQGPTEVRLLSLRRFLQRSYEYSLEIENLGSHDPLSNFLFHEQKGHCEYFATAGALLCRALGVPARVAYGWTGGRYYEPHGLFVFRAREAHAWTEIFLRDIGWVVFDTTPPAALEANFSTAPPEESPPLPESAPFGLTPESPLHGTASRWAYPALGIGLALIPLVLLVQHLRHRRHRRRREHLGENSILLPDPPGYLARFKRACSRLGHPMPPGRTLRQQLSSLHQHDLQPDFAAELLKYHYATTYGNSPPDQSVERKLARAIKTW